MKMKMMMTGIGIALGSLLTIGTVSSASAAAIQTIWGNQAGPGNLIEWDKNNGNDLIISSQDMEMGAASLKLATSFIRR